jgi:NAD dependent epimerase/dehydratase family enzyme
MKTLGRIMKRPVLSVAVPAFLLKLILGEMAEVILTGSRASSDKIINSGFRFRFGNLEEALTDVLLK